MSPLKLVDLGTPEMAVPPLRALVDAGHEIVRVITRVDKRRGRGGATSPSPVKAAAVELGLPVGHDPDEVLDAVVAGAELGVVVAYGRIIKPHLLDAMPMVNLHFSLLPRWRGAAPVERAILAGDTETGVAVMGVEEGLDTGPIHAEERVPIDRDTTADDLRVELVDVGTRLLVDTLSRPVDEWIDRGRPQEGEPVYAAKIGKEELEIDLDAAGELQHRLVRLGGAWTTFRGRRLKVHEAHVTEGRLVPTVVQPEGKPRMDADAWRNGARPTADEPFGDL
ncbi:MAG: methionyl-tRNA formyltransferase [Actinomycetota bacterium]